MLFKMLKEGITVSGATCSKLKDLFCNGDDARAVEEVKKILREKGIAIYDSPKLVMRACMTELFDVAIVFTSFLVHIYGDIHRATIWVRPIFELDTGIRFSVA